LEKYKIIAAIVKKNGIKNTKNITTLVVTNGWKIKVMHKSVIAVCLKFNQKNIFSEAETEIFCHPPAVLGTCLEYCPSHGK